jgi:hypothetical protein
MERIADISVMHFQSDAQEALEREALFYGAPRNVATCAPEKT